MMMHVHKGKCHCGNIAFDYSTECKIEDIPVRGCSCSFCQKTGARYSSDPSGSLNVHYRNPDEVIPYRFGHKTADFVSCRICGVPSVLLSEIDGHLYGLINVNTLDEVAKLQNVSAVGDLDGEGNADRLSRRKRNWIGNVEVAD